MDLQYPPPPKRGVFVVFEGLNGAGKSTCLSAVAAKLREVYPDTPVVETKEPTSDTPIGRLLRRVLAGEETLADPLTFQALCAADRLEHAATVLRPAMERGAIVLCDRYVLSSVAYCAPGAKDAGPGAQWVRSMNRWAPEADLTIVLTLNVVDAHRRVLARDGAPNSLVDDPTVFSWAYNDPSTCRLFSHSRGISFVDGAGAPDIVAGCALSKILALLAFCSQDSA